MSENTTETPQSREEFEPMQYVTFPDSTLDARVKIFNAHRNAKSLASLADAEIEVVNVLAEVGKRARTNVPCQNTYLFTGDGEIYFTQSTGIADTINELMSMVNGDISGETSKGYIKVRVKEFDLGTDESGEARTYKQLELLEI